MRGALSLFHSKQAVLSSAEIALGLKNKRTPRPAWTCSLRSFSDAEIGPGPASTGCVSTWWELADGETIQFSTRYAVNPWRLPGNSQMPSRPKKINDNNFTKSPSLRNALKRNWILYGEREAGHTRDYRCRCRVASRRLFLLVSLESAIW